MLLTIVLGMIGAAALRERAPELPNNMVISFDTADGLSEKESYGGFMQYFEQEPELSTREIVTAIREAAYDPRVSALVMRVDTFHLGLARLQELREAVLFFREFGKHTYAFADTFGFEGSGDNGYYLASAFDEIWLQPSGDWGVSGIAVEMPFLRGLLDKLGIVPNFSTREEYKSAMSFLTDKGFKPADREAMRDLVENILEQKLTAIGIDRDIPYNELRGWIDESPLSAEQAKTRNLVNTLGYTTQLREKIKQDAGHDAEFLSLADYSYNIEKAKGPTVAVIYATGAIMRGKDEGGAFEIDHNAHSEDLARALRGAAQDDDIAAIMLRVDSPGGSYVASDTVWNAVMEAKKKKPVYAVMGDVAASGGYYIAMGADRIFAMPGTLTGSIGVVAGKISVNPLAQKLDVNIDKIQIGENADMWSPASDFSPAAKAKLEQWLDRTYADFLSKVSLSRDLPPDEVRAAAKGRVWTGAQAYELGLIDGIGGWMEAEDDLRLELSLSDDQELHFELYPKPKHRYEEILEYLASYGVMLRSQPVFGTQIGRALLSLSSMDGSVQARAPYWLY